jgi:pSer/pThr/pTyr-binding forkhead associated (FHA) protein
VLDWLRNIWQRLTGARPRESDIPVAVAVPVANPARTTPSRRVDPRKTARLRMTTVDEPAGVPSVDEPRRPPPLPPPLPGAGEPASAVALPIEADDEATEICDPVMRDPAPILMIFDDGRDTGEAVRIRQSPSIIGRSLGQVRIPHDEGISDPHAELAWRESQAERALHLRDLGSAGGTFVRVVQARLHDGQEFRLGAGRFRLSESGELEEIGADGGEPRRSALADAEVLLGRDSETCQIVLAHDPMVSPRHARLARDAKGRWQLTDLRSLNGTWVRIDEIQVGARSEFLLGEQRFGLLWPGKSP